MQSLCSYIMCPSRRITPSTPPCFICFLLLILIRSPHPPSPSSLYFCADPCGLTSDPGSTRNKLHFNASQCRQSQSHLSRTPSRDGGRRFPIRRARRDGAGAVHIPCIAVSLYGRTTTVCSHPSAVTSSSPSLAPSHIASFPFFLDRMRLIADAFGMYR
jgi:hypothetical protein